jgi:hypothetical protein
MHQGIAPCAVELELTRPFFYGAPINVFAGLGATSGGRDYPYSYPYNYGTTTGGQVFVTEFGNAPTYARLALVPAGVPIEDPRIIVQQTGELLQFVGLTIPPGEVLFVDFAARVAQLSVGGSLVNPIDVSNRIDRPVSNWWTGTGLLPPGELTIIGSGAQSGTLIVGYDTAWLI